MKIIADDTFKKVEDISLEYLLSHHIMGVILDIDNTMVIDGQMEVSQSVSAWLQNLELPICLLSNGKEQRVKHFADTFQLGYVYKAQKPSKRGYIRAAELLGIEDHTRIAVIGDQLFSDILGGRMAGCYTIKVEPIDQTADPFVVKVKRWFERFVR